MFSQKVRMVLIVGVAGFVLALLGIGLFSDAVGPTQWGMRINVGGQIVERHLEPGRHSKTPGLTHIVTLPTQWQVYTSDKSDVNVNDGTIYNVKFQVIWRINDGYSYYQAFAGKSTFGANHAGAGANQVDNIVYANVKEAIRSVDADAMFRQEPSQLFGSAIKGSQNTLKGFGIDVFDIRLVEIDLPVSARTSALTAQQATVQTQAAQIKAQGDLQAAQIAADTTRKVGEVLGAAQEYVGQKRGQADAEALSLLRQAVPDPKLYNLLQSAQAMQSLPKGSKIFITPESPLYQFVQGKAITTP